jgi:hypothetical protein
MARATFGKHLLARFRIALGMSRADAGNQSSEDNRDTDPTHSFLQLRMVLCD